VHLAIDAIAAIRATSADAAGLIKGDIGCSDMEIIVASLLRATVDSMRRCSNDDGEEAANVDEANGRVTRHSSVTRYYAVTDQTAAIWIGCAEAILQESRISTIREIPRTAVFQPPDT
jgi:hypothetical protein